MHEPNLISHPLNAETCMNCGRVIPPSETPTVWAQTVVCAACHEQLLQRSIEAAFIQSRRPRPSRFDYTVLKVLLLCTSVAMAGGLLVWFITQK